MRSMVFCATVVALLFLSVTPSSAYIDSVHYWPSQPNEGQNLWVQVYLWLPDPCWRLDGTSQAIVGQELRAGIDLFDTQPNAACPTVIVEEYAEFRFTNLAAGSHLLVVTERRFNLYGLQGTQVVTIPIEVSGDVAARGESFTAVKRLFR